MNKLGVIHVASMLYLSGIICLSISLNENETVGRIVRETLRRWFKFALVTVALIALVTLMD